MVGLQPFIDGGAFIATPVHPYFPFPWAHVIHAARTSMAFQNNARAASAKTNVKQTWPAYIAGYLVMAWGGGVITHQLLGLPAPQLTYFNPYIVYITTHIVITLLFRILPFLPSLLPYIDMILFPIDAIVRVGSITGAVSLMSPTSPTHASVNSALSGSILTHMIIGAFASAGGGLTASTFSTWSPNWTFSTPPFLQAPSMIAFIFASMDLWAGALIAALYGVLTGHEAFALVRSLGFMFLVLSGRLDAVKLDMDAVWTAVDAKAFASMLLAGFFGLRALRGLWLTRATSVEAAKKKKDASKIKKQ